MKSRSKLTEEQRDVLREAIRFFVPNGKAEYTQDILDELNGMDKDEINAWASGVGWMFDKVNMAIDNVTCFRHYDALNNNN